MQVAMKFYDRKTGITYNEDQLPPERLKELKSRWGRSLAAMASNLSVRKERAGAPTSGVGKKGA